MPSQYDDLILNCLHRKSTMTSAEIIEKIGRVLVQAGAESPEVRKRTIQKRLQELCRMRKIRYQKEGYFIDSEWKEGTPKAFILIELTSVKKPKNYQKELVEEIHKAFEDGKFSGLNLIGIDITMGAEFSLIIQVYADDLHPIGKFVKEYLLTHEFVTKTRTIMVWPTKAKSDPNP